jgi:hypothetical protein
MRRKTVPGNPIQDTALSLGPAALQRNPKVRPTTTPSKSCVDMLIPFARAQNFEAQLCVELFADIGSFDAVEAIRLLN